MAKFQSIAEIVPGVPQARALVNTELPAAITAPSRTKTIRVKISGPDAERIATILWQTNASCAEQINQKKAPNIVIVEAE